MKKIVLAALLAITTFASMISVTAPVSFAQEEPQPEEPQPEKPSE